MKSMSFICPQHLFHKFSGLEINACAGTCLVCVTQSGSYHSPLNVFPLLFVAEHGLGKLGVVIEPWGHSRKQPQSR